MSQSRLTCVPLFRHISLTDITDCSTLLKSLVSSIIAETNFDFSTRFRISFLYSSNMHSIKSFWGSCEVYVIFSLSKKDLTSPLYCPRRSSNSTKLPLFENVADSSLPRKAMPCADKETATSIWCCSIWEYLDALWWCCVISLCLALSRALATST